MWLAKRRYVQDQELKSMKYSLGSLVQMKLIINVAMVRVAKYSVRLY